MRNSISAVILAGGAASRFNGIMKPKIIVGGRTILSRIIEGISGLFSEIIIVTNNPESFTDAEGYILVKDEITSAGPLGGIHAAMKATASEAVFVIAGDMPYPDRMIIKRMIDFYRSSSYSAVIPVLRGLQEPLHAIYSVSLLPDLETFLLEGGNRAVRDFINNIYAFPLQFEDSDIARKAFTNINSPSDLTIVEDDVTD